MSFFLKIGSEFRMSGIGCKLLFWVLPVALSTYLFHETGHWFIGELLGNDMLLSLNNSVPRSGAFLTESHRLWSAIGGPAFTILQASVFSVITYRTGSTVAFFVVFFAAFVRFFAVLFGGIARQDEGRIASMLGVGPIFVIAALLLPLALLVWICSRKMGFRLQDIGYHTVLGTAAILAVIGLLRLFG